MAVATDYYPFGLAMDGREMKRKDWKYGYQGEYAEKDEESGWNQFQLRMYDPIIGRWLSVDPAGQYASGYVGMGNNPANGVDPDGAFKTWFGAFRGWVGGGFRGWIGKASKGSGGSLGDWFVGRSVQDGGPGVVITSNRDFGKPVDNRWINDVAHFAADIVPSNNMARLLFNKGFKRKCTNGNR